MCLTCRITSKTPLPWLTSLYWLWSDYVSLLYTPGNGSKGEDLYVLPRRAFTGELFYCSQLQCKIEYSIACFCWPTKGISFVFVSRWSVSKTSPLFTEYPSCWKNRVSWTTSASVWIWLSKWVPEKCSQSGKRWLTGMKIFHCSGCYPKLWNVSF